MLKFMIPLALIGAAALAQPSLDPQAQAAADEARQAGADAMRAATLPKPKPKAYRLSTAKLKARWGRLEEECRGGQHSPDDAVCTERDKVGEALRRRGVCWAYSDWRVTPPWYEWHPCSQKRPQGWRP